MTKKYHCLTTLLLLVVGALSSWAQLPYQNPRLSVEERINDLLGRLTLDEKVSLMMNSSPAIPRLGIPPFEWWSEALHGVGRNGVATVFPQCIGMACSFDNQLLERIYTAVSDEARAKNTIARRDNQLKRYRGLSFWTPNINIFRDPRWGRGQETYGEDPFMNAQMGLAVVRGLQGMSYNGEWLAGPNGQLSNGQWSNGQYKKLLACAKHYAVHSGPEKTRHHFNIEDLPQRDLWDTYLPAFKTLVQEGNVQQVMCAYQRFEGDPCCGSNRLLQQILRDEWGFKGLVVSDCGAIDDFYKPQRHEVSADSAAASAKAVLSGTDVECGRSYRSLPEAVRRGDISEEQIDVSVRRLLKGRFELGDFDPDSLVEWTRIPERVVACAEHKQLALQMAREQMVLLKNNGVLPLVNSKSSNSKLVVMGPNAADSIMLWGIYFGQPSHTVTVLEGIEKKIGRVRYYQACGITDMTVTQQTISGTSESRDGSTTLELRETSRRTNTISDVLQAAKDAETVIFVGGISPNLEREEAKKVEAPGFDKGDRTSIELPKVQRDILKALHDAGKKVVLVNCSGSAVALEQEDAETCDAILQAWYAGEQGGHAVADVLFGDYNPSGKLAVTFYRNDAQLPAFDDYRMVGRTYRYFQGRPLYPFGYGLSYTTFTIGTPQYKNGKVRVKVKNTGQRDGTEIVQVYIRNPRDAEGPLKTLRGYQRVDLKRGQSKVVEIALPRERFELWDAATNTMRVVPGTYEIWVGSSSADNDLKKTMASIR
ncbi:MAG: glycoside hydrolase family 3 C-terminal domain-containing protein [Prevotella sp.]|nr:glycoside hydrolase family 3 C-terminal domain-containing protein [Prevotella sp.]